jgi:hypothetical protein
MLCKKKAAVTLKMMKMWTSERRFHTANKDAAYVVGVLKDADV